MSYQEIVRQKITKGKIGHTQTYLAQLDISEFEFQPWKIFPIDTGVDVLNEI